MARTFGCARYVYNWALRLRTDAYYERQERVSYADTSVALTLLKQQPATAWLNAVSSVPPQQTLRHLDKAFRNFFEGRAKYPAFKKKRGRQAAEYTTSAFQWQAETCTLLLAKMDSPLDIHWSRSFTGTPTTVTVSRDCARRYFVSFLVEEEIAPLPVVNAMVGVDVGLKDVAVLSTGEKIANPDICTAANAGWRMRNARSLAGRKGPRIGKKPVARWRGSTPASRTNDLTACTS